MNTVRIAGTLAFLALTLSPVNAASPGANKPQHHPGGQGNQMMSCPCCSMMMQGMHGGMGMGGPGGGMGSGMGMSGGGMGMRGGMMPHMMDKMKADDEKIAKLVDAMNAAPADKKAEATAAVVNELVSERNSMRSMMRDSVAEPGNMGPGAMPMPMPGGPMGSPPPDAPPSPDHAH